jgi:hypothetical protein
VAIAKAAVSVAAKVAASGATVARVGRVTTKQQPQRLRSKNHG